MEPVKVSICCLLPAYGFIINKKFFTSRGSRSVLEERDEYRTSFF